MKGGRPTRATTVSYRHIMFTILPLVYHYADSAEITDTSRKISANYIIWNWWYNRCSH